MEHDFVLKYQTSKISNIKTKISNNIQTLYLNKTINTMTVFTWNLKFVVVVAWICPMIVLEHITERILHGAMDECVPNPLYLQQKNDRLIIFAHFSAAAEPVGSQACSNNGNFIWCCLLQKA